MGPLYLVCQLRTVTRPHQVHLVHVDGQVVDHGVEHSLDERHVWIAFREDLVLLLGGGAVLTKRRVSHVLLGSGARVQTGGIHAREHVRTHPVWVTQIVLRSRHSQQLALSGGVAQEGWPSAHACGVPHQHTDGTAPTYLPSVWGDDDEWLAVARVQMIQVVLVYRLEPSSCITMKKYDRREGLAWKHRLRHERIDGLALYAAALARERAPLGNMTLGDVLSLAMNALVVTGGPGVAGPPRVKFGLPQSPALRLNFSLHRSTKSQPGSSKLQVQKGGVTRRHS
jgi:hypothetical protein